MEYEYTNTPASSTSTSAAASSSQSGASAVNGGSTSRRASTAVANTGKEFAVTAHGSRKRKNTIVQHKERISNMVSFENPCLKDGVLTADDGTTFAVHGTKIRNPSCFTGFAPNMLPPKFPSVKAHSSDWLNPDFLQITSF